MHREYHKWFSPNLNRDMELLVFGHSGARVLVFPTRRGRFYEYEELGLVNALADRLENGWLQLFCVDSVDRESIYNRYIPPPERIKRHGQYEEYILNEVLPFSRLKNPQPFMISHGCSLGAYHAANIAFRHPQWFGKLVALSGRYDLSAPVAEFRGLFDNYYDEDIYFHNPNHFLPNLGDGIVLDELRRMQIVMTVGAADPFLNSNLALSETLGLKNVSHEFYIWDGRAHQADDWYKMVQIYL
ncbi:MULTISPECIES: esterase family protein [Spirosoma]|jgi:esterase/lipase superfamily enzyme|uniref:Esterase family protein n=2 Tax=Spirosoma TaxID=107 RepID=A0A6G9AJA3_9BACT|nr:MULTISPECIES: alpha/beta hydrolase-fold protein [Spirosoma]QHV97330.1 esterase [Spirosoma endbachense]QIP12528.1 esterase family protein [Spirosoma aureum]